MFSKNGYIKLIKEPIQAKGEQIQATLDHIIVKQNNMLNLVGSAITFNHGCPISDFTTNDRLVVSGGEDGTIKLWNPEILVGSVGSKVECISLAPSTPLISAGFQKKVSLFDLNAQKELFSLSTNDWIQQISWKADSSAFVTSTKDNLLRVFDPRVSQECLVVMLDNVVRNLSCGCEAKWGSLVWSNRYALHDWV